MTDGIFPSIKSVPVEQLIPYARNARTHSDEQIAQIAASIREFGWTNPILVDGKRGIIAGHGRLAAARKLGMAEVPVIELQHLTEAQKRAYILADNQLALNAGWDTELLKIELGDLAEQNFDLSLLGFDERFLDSLLADDKPEALSDPDATPEYQEDALSIPGDIWLLGDHRLMCGDSTDMEQVAALMNSQRAALLHADPPYGMGKENDGVANDNLCGDKLDKFQMDWWRAFRPFLLENASAYVWGNAPDLWRLWYQGGLFASERLTIRNEIVWNKGSAQGMSSSDKRMFPTASERCLFFMIGEQGFNTNSDNYWEGWEPIRSHLETEMKKAGWTVKDLNRITGTQMGGHWVSKSQWQLITAEHYAKIQQAARDHDAFKRDYEALKRDYEALKRDYEALKRDFYETRAYFDNTHDTMIDVWDFPRVAGDERHGHATPKPVAMMERIMKSSLPAGAICAEPFGGSGSTLMAAEKTGRVCYTMELLPQYVDVIIRRWQNFTGKKAIHAATGKTFDEVASHGNTAIPAVA